MEVQPQVGHRRMVGRRPVGPRVANPFRGLRRQTGHPEQRGRRLLLDPEFEWPGDALPRIHVPRRLDGKPHRFGAVLADELGALQTVRAELPLDADGSRFTDTKRLRIYVVPMAAAANTPAAGGRSQPRLAASGARNTLGPTSAVARIARCGATIMANNSPWEGAPSGPRNPSKDPTIETSSAPR